MRRAAGIGAGLVTMALLAAGPVAAQEGDGLIGRWHTASEGGVVQIERCGPVLCGRLIDAAPLRADPDQTDVRNRRAALRSRPLRGLLVLRAFTGGPTVWTGGPLYDPESGQEAGSGRLTLTDRDTLSVRGCIAPLLCRTQTWTRVR